MTYYPGPAPLNSGPLGAYVRAELEKIARELAAPEVLHVEPEKPRDGLICVFDGVDFNPGSGPGLYYYYGGTWNFAG